MFDNLERDYNDRSNYVSSIEREFNIERVSDNDGEYDENYEN